jgi:uncharacterized protein
MKHELDRSVRWGVRRRTDFMRNSRLARAVFSQQNRGVERIRDYRFGHVIIDGEAHARDVIVLPSRVVANWWRREGHSLVLDDLDDVIAELPRTLIVGCGASTSCVVSRTSRRRSTAGLEGICGRPQTFDGGRGPTPAERPAGVREEPEQDPPLPCPSLCDIPEHSQQVFRDIA